MLRFLLFFSLLPFEHPNSKGPKSVPFMLPSCNQTRKGPLTAVIGEVLLYTYVSSYYYIHVSSYHYICVLILLFICVSSYICAHVCSRILTKALCC
jgi:hypothetical protein